MAEELKTKEMIIIIGNGLRLWDGWCDPIEAEVIVAMDEYADQFNKPVCTWRLVDNGSMGFSDYEYETGCGVRYDREKGVGNYNFCPHCGGRIDSFKK